MICFLTVVLPSLILTIGTVRIDVATSSSKIGLYVSIKLLIQSRSRSVILWATGFILNCIVNLSTVRVIVTLLLLPRVIIISSMFIEKYVSNPVIDILFTFQQKYFDAEDLKGHVFHGISIRSAEVSTVFFDVLNVNRMVCTSHTRCRTVILFHIRNS